jgi:HEPN domain-containing protein
MKSNLDFARGLARKADHDLQLVDVALDHGAPLDALCFHLQQAAEKLLKAALSSHAMSYPLTHDLEALLDLALPQLPRLAPFRDRLLAFSSYAVEMRYDEEIYPDREEVEEARTTVRDLRQLLTELLPPEVLR